MNKIKTSFFLTTLLFKVFVVGTLAVSWTAAAEPLLNGVATHAELGKEQFVAGLFVSTLSDSSNSILTSQEEKRLEVRVLADALSSRRFRRMWIEGMAINSTPAELEKHARNMAAFSNLVKIKMISGDTFSVDRTLSNVSVSVNGTQLGTIDDPKFFDLLLRTWIGPVPLSSDFRADLLTQGVIKPGPLSRFESTQPTEERVTIIQQAVAAKLAATSGAGQSAAAAVAAPKPEISVPQQRTSQPEPETSAPKVAIEAPKLSVPEVTPEPTPTPEPQVVLAPVEEALDESIFDDDDVDEFTAESLLKEQLYYSQLAKYTHRFLQYPQRAWDRGREGNIRLRVTIDRKGKVKNTEILEEAKYKSLNKEAQKAVGRASPYPAMPDEIRGDDYTFTFRVAFKIVDR